MKNLILLLLTFSIGLCFATSINNTLGQVKQFEISENKVAIKDSLKDAFVSTSEFKNQDQIADITIEKLKELKSSKEKIYVELCANSNSTPIELSEDIHEDTMIVDGEEFEVSISTKVIVICEENDI